MEIPIIVSVWRRANISKFTLNIPQGGTKDSFMVILAILKKHKFSFYIFDIDVLWHCQIGEMFFDLIFKMYIEHISIIVITQNCLWKYFSWLARVHCFLAWLLTEHLVGGQVFALAICVYLPNGSPSWLPHHGLRSQKSGRSSRNVEVRAGYEWRWHAANYFPLAFSFLQKGGGWS